MRSRHPHCKEQADAAFCGVTEERRNCRVHDLCDHTVCLPGRSTLWRYPTRQILWILQRSSAWISITDFKIRQVDRRPSVTTVPEKVFRGTDGLSGGKAASPRDDGMSSAQRPVSVDPCKSSYRFWSLQSIRMTLPVTHPHVWLYCRSGTECPISTDRSVSMVFLERKAGCHFVLKAFWLSFQRQKSICIFAIDPVILYTTTKVIFFFTRQLSHRDKQVLLMFIQKG